MPFIWPNQRQTQLVAPDTFLNLMITDPSPLIPNFMCTINLQLHPHRLFVLFHVFSNRQIKQHSVPSAADAC